MKVSNKRITANQFAKFLIGKSLKHLADQVEVENQMFWLDKHPSEKELAEIKRHLNKHIEGIFSQRKITAPFEEIDQCFDGVEEPAVEIPVLDDDDIREEDCCQDSADGFIRDLMPQKKAKKEKVNCWNCGIELLNSSDTNLCKGCKETEEFIDEVMK